MACESARCDRTFVLACLGSWSPARIPGGYTLCCYRAANDPLWPDFVRGLCVLRTGTDEFGNSLSMASAHPDMRRCLTGPSPDGPSPHDRGRSRGRSRAARRCRGDSRPGHGGESAGDAHPYHAHVRVAWAWGAGRPGSRPSARRWPGATAVGTGRSSGAGPGIASRSDPGRGHRLGHGARTSGGRGRHRARAARASGPRPRRRLMPGAAGLVPGHAARRRRPQCAAAPPGRDGGRQSRLPAGQQPT